jgi:hypothetical protein
MDVTRLITQDKAVLTSLGIELTSWGPDPLRNTVKIVLTHWNPSIEAKLKSRYGSDMVTVSDQPEARPVRTGRTSDVRPFWGGDEIFGNGSTLDCNSGPSMQQASGGASPQTLTTFALTAGHCAVTGAKYWTNDKAQLLMGPVSTRHFNDGGLDVEAIQASTEPLVWGGTNPGNHDVVGIDYSEDGKQMCIDGAEYGQQCDATEYDVDSCVEFEDLITTCHLVRAAKPEINICAPGDSGAPTYSLAGGGNAYISGTIVGCSTLNDVVWYQLILNTENRLGMGVQFYPNSVPGGTVKDTTSCGTCGPSD